MRVPEVVGKWPADFMLNGSGVMQGDSEGGLDDKLFMLMTRRRSWVMLWRALLRLTPYVEAANASGTDTR